MDHTSILRAYKYCGTGNDFLFVNLLDHEECLKMNAMSDGISRGVLAKRLCRRHSGAGADGLIFIEKSDRSDFKWDFYNCDGSVADMCGNAARCAIRFANEVLKITRAEINFEASKGVISGRCLGEGQVEIHLPRPKIIQNEVEVRLIDQTVSGAFILAGVPHFVITAPFTRVSDLSSCVALEIQGHERFQPESTNVTFISLRGRSTARAVSFERGVKRFTLACGTGALAAALTLANKTGSIETLVEMPGGKLKVKLKKDSAQLQGQVRSLGVFESWKEILNGK